MKPKPAQKRLRALESKGCGTSEEVGHTGLHSPRRYRLVVGTDATDSWDAVAVLSGESFRRALQLATYHSKCDGEN